MSQIATHSNLDCMWSDLLADLAEGSETPSRNGGCREIVGWAGGLSNPQYCAIADDRRKWSAGYASAELLWYLMGKSDSEMMSAYSSKYAGFCNDGEAMGAYGKRMRSNPGIAAKGGGRSSLRVALDVLLKKREDRRAVVALFDSGDVVEAERGEWKDLPCTLTLQFLARDGRLHLQTSMRSNDAWLGTPYDVHCFCQIQALMAAALDLRLGKYLHVVGSMHLYDSNYEKATQIVALPAMLKLAVAVPEPSVACAKSFFEEGVPEWVRDRENEFRNGDFSEVYSVLERVKDPDDGWWCEKLLACARKLGAPLAVVDAPLWARGVAP
jgi:thymidylate synthase